MDKARKARILFKVKIAMSDSDKRLLGTVLPVAAVSSALGAGGAYLLKKKLEKSKALHPTTVHRIGRLLMPIAPILAGGTAIAMAAKQHKLREALQGRS